MSTDKIKVAVRVRPFNRRGKLLSIINKLKSNLIVINKIGNIESTRHFDLLINNLIKSCIIDIIEFVRFNTDFSILFLSLSLEINN